jgi:formamidopyrimidine-DNA glycosylase
MPELPEIETVKLQLSTYLIGQKISSVKSLHQKSLFGDPKKIAGHEIVAIKRLGKMLVLETQNKFIIAIHFKMSGQLILVKSDKRKVKRGEEDFGNRIVGGHPTEDWIRPLPSKHTRVIITLASGDVLYFNDQRLFGWVKILTDSELAELPFVKNLGPEIWDISAKEFYQKLQTKNKAIKIAIMDQDMISGVGNIYANDALWDARIYPGERARDLRYKDTKILRASLIKVLKEGIKYGGATAADAKYMDLHGMGGTYQEHFRTYDRTGAPCLRCKTIIKKITLGGRGTYFCPKCQKLTYNTAAHSH